MRRGLLLGLILCIGLPLPAFAGTTKVLSADSSNHFEVRPSLIGYTGDSSGYFGKRTWGGQARICEVDVLDAEPCPGSRDSLGQDLFANVR